jgi:transcriptional regulator with XRE-family HTH domain
MPTSINSPHRHYLKEWRLKRGLTQRELGEKLATSKGMISRYETGERGMTLEVQFALMEALDITLAQFFAHPDRESLDAVVEGASEEERARALAVLKAFVNH